MKRFVTRRDLLKLAGGSALGVLMTPIPWKLADDSAIWTQNWSLIPPLPRGAESVKHTACTLCPGGCPVRARCVGGMPVSLSAVAGHPAGAGALCPLGFAGHHLAFHQARITRPMKRISDGYGEAWRPVSIEEVSREICRRLDARGAAANIGVLDRRPGRGVSMVYREFLSRFGGGIYVTPHHCEESTLRSLRRMVTPDPGPLGFDLAHAAVVLSFGAPLLEGWGAPGTLDIFGARAGGPHLVQVESIRSVTGRRAALRVPVRPGSEGDLARGIARAILAGEPRLLPGVRSVGDLDAYRRLVGKSTPEEVSRKTGVDPVVVDEIAGRLLGAGPSVVIGGGDPAGGPPDGAARHAIAALNVLAGAFGRTGGILRRTIPGGTPHDSCAEAELCDLPEGSLQVLFIDEAPSGLALPPQSIRSGIDPGDGIVVAFSPFLAGPALAADYVIPAPAPYESPEEVSSPPTDPRAALTISAPLFASGSGTPDRPAFLAGILRALGMNDRGIPTAEESTARRIAAAAHSPGRVLRPAAGAGASPEFEELPAEAATPGILTAGGWWISENPKPGPAGTVRLVPGNTERETVSAGFTRGREEGRLVLLPVGWRGAAGGTAAPALAGKLYRESGLRPASGQVTVHPSTGAACGVGDGERATLATRRGRIGVVVRHASAVMPGVIEAGCGPALRANGEFPDLLALCEPGDGGAWNATEATLEAL